MSPAAAYAASLSPAMARALMAFPDEVGRWSTIREMKVSNRALGSFDRWDVREPFEVRWVKKDWREYSNRGCYEYCLTEFGLEVKEALKRMED